MISLDLPGGRVDLHREDIGLLRDGAAAQAGRSSAARDLSLLLDRALEPGRPVAFRRGELQTLIQVAGDAGLDDLAAELARFAGGQVTGNP